MKTQRNYEKMLCSIIDSHSHIVGLDYSNMMKERYPISNNIIDFQQKTKQNGIGYYIVMTLCSTIYYNYKRYWETGKFETSGLCDYPFQYENTYLVQSAEYFCKGKALPFLSFSLQDKIKEQERSIINLIERYDVYGLKFHCKIDQKSALDIMTESDFINIAKSYNIPITIHTELKPYCNPLNVYELAEKNPKVRFCAAHAGDFSREFIERLKKKNLKNLYLDCCPLIYKCKEMMKIIPLPEKYYSFSYYNPSLVLNELYEMFPMSILWGSDDPWIRLGGFRDNKGVRGADYSEEAKVIKNFIHRYKITQNTIRYIRGW